MYPPHQTHHATWQLPRRRENSEPESEDSSSSEDFDSDVRCTLGDNTTIYALQPPNQRTVFYRIGQCRIHGHPSTGGVLIIDKANLVDMLFLGIPRLVSSDRAEDAVAEDSFCDLLRRLGAVWWRTETAWHRWHSRGKYGDSSDEEESEGEIEREKNIKVLTFGWPSDGIGVWILRHDNDWQKPKDFCRLDYAMSMDERIQVMTEYGAEFVEDPSQLEELRYGQNEPRREKDSCSCFNTGTAADSVDS
nr:hypothetical protein B0A51_06385 [Rachicladosporium sp. CCFEE 5018]